MPKPSADSVAHILDQVRPLAVQYQRETGKPLGITGEIAEFEAARLLGLELCEARQEGYDARWPLKARRRNRRVQIKGRRVLDPSKPRGRLGSIKLGEPWDTVVLVLLDAEFRPLAIYEAGRAVIEEALQAPGSKARTVRGSLSIAKFKSIGKLVWSHGARGARERRW